jgi:transketolase
LEAFSSQDGKKNDAQTLPRVVKVAPREMPGSGTPEELMDAAGISAAKIVEVVKKQI